MQATTKKVDDLYTASLEATLTHRVDDPCGEAKWRKTNGDLVTVRYFIVVNFPVEVLALMASFADTAELQQRVHITCKSMWVANDLRTDAFYRLIKLIYQRTEDRISSVISRGTLYPHMGKILKMEHEANMLISNMYTVHISTFITDAITVALPMRHQSFYMNPHIELVCEFAFDCIVSRAADTGKVSIIVTTTDCVVLLVSRMSLGSATRAISNLPRCFLDHFDVTNVGTTNWPLYLKQFIDKAKTDAAAAKIAK